MAAERRRYNVDIHGEKYSTQPVVPIVEGPYEDVRKSISGDVGAHEQYLNAALGHVQCASSIRYPQGFLTSPLDRSAGLGMPAGDGYIDAIYSHLWSKDGSTNRGCPHVLIPDTVHLTLAHCWLTSPHPGRWCSSTV